ncbi:hypothetical protein U9M48_019169, partial [Paspalum notatum var. saurae]
TGSSSRSYGGVNYQNPLDKSTMWTNGANHWFSNLRILCIFVSHEGLTKKERSTRNQNIRFDKVQLSNQPPKEATWE